MRENPVKRDEIQNVVFADLASIRLFIVIRALLASGARGKDANVLGYSPAFGFLRPIASPRRAFDPKS